MKTIILKSKLNDEEIKKLHGNYLDESYIDHLIEDDTIVYDEKENIKAVFLKNIIPQNLCKQAYYSLRKAATKSNNRGQAAGPLPDNLKIGDKIDGLTIGEINGNRFKPLKKDGTLSNSPKAKQVNSGIIGYSDRYARIPYCRTTEFTYKHFEQYKKSLPYIRYISNLFKNTVFTTVTVNKNFRTASHYDAGDLEEGFGNLAVLQTGDYTGGYTVMPKYGIGLNVRNFDLALFDVHELHGNTEIKSKGFYERISIVCYFRKKMIECGSAKEELERIKHK
jgi:hypothetical protein